MKKTLWILMALSISVVPAAGALAKGAHLATDTNPEAQAQVKKRLDEILVRLRQEGLRQAGLVPHVRTEVHRVQGRRAARRRGGQPENGGAELGMLGDPKVDMKDLAVNVYGDTAIATFNGDFSAKMQGKPLAMKLATTMVFVKYKGDWKIVHEHFSPIGPPPGMPPGAPAK